MRTCVCIDHFNLLTFIDCVCIYVNSCEKDDMMTSRFGLQCSDSEHSAIIMCAGATMCSDDYKCHTSPHTHMQINEHNAHGSIIMLSYVYGPIDYDS